MSQVDVYISGPLRGLPLRTARSDASADLARETRGWLAPASTGLAAGHVIHLTDADVDDWRDQVLFGGAVAGDTALNDAAIDEAAAAAPVDWQPEAHGFTGSAVVLAIIAAAAFWFGLRILTSGAVHGG